MTISQLIARIEALYASASAGADSQVLLEAIAKLHLDITTETIKAATMRRGA